MQCTYSYYVIHAFGLCGYGNERIDKLGLPFSRPVIAVVCDVCHSRFVIKVACFSKNYR